MHSGAIGPSRLGFSSLPLVSSNRFSAWEEVHLEGSGYVLPVVCRKSRRRFARRRFARHLRLSPDLTLSDICVSGDWGSDDPCTLRCVVNQKQSATCMIDSGARSQFF